MTTSLLHVSLFTFLAALALDYEKLLAYVTYDLHGHPFKLPSNAKRITTSEQCDEHIEIKDPYDIFDTIHSTPPVRIHQPIHVITIDSLVLEPEISDDPQERRYRVPFDALADRAIIFEDRRTVVKTTKDVIGDLRNDPMCVAIIASREETLRIFIYDLCFDAFFIKITSLYRHSEYKTESFKLENAVLYIVK